MVFLPRSGLVQPFVAGATTLTGRGLNSNVRSLGEYGLTTAALADLEELVLLCRDERARTYISEAVGCYRSGSYRAAIVAVWIAVCFDTIDKIRELSFTGDKQAADLMGEFDKARAANDIAWALRFEKELLNHARDRFEFISHVEAIDLERLQEDRNRCAHPSLASEDQPFMPSAELARLHLRTAVSHLLQHPPVQGKAALEKLLRDLESEYYPVKSADVMLLLSSGPLRRPRPSLTRNFIVVLLKQAIEKNVDWKVRRKCYATLEAIRKMHVAAFGQTCDEKLCGLLSNLDDAHLGLATSLLWQVDDLWQFLPPGVCLRLEAYVESIPTEDIDDLFFLLQYPPLARRAITRVARMTTKDFTNLLVFDMPEAMAQRLVDLYVTSGNYSDANARAKLVTAHAADIPAAIQKELVRRAAANYEVRNSFEISAVIGALRKSGKIPAPEFQTLLTDSGLEKFAAQFDDA